MGLSPDALLLGPLALSWPNLALLLGVLVFTALAARQGLEHQAGWLVLVTLLAARVGYALEHFSSWPSLGAALWGVVDIRTGGWNWPWGLAVGVLVAGLWLKDQARSLLGPVLASLVLAALPLGVQQSLRHAPAPAQPEAVLAYLEPSQVHLGKARFSELPKPLLLNFWATWCPPCRAEMPLLVAYQQKGYPIVLLNAGEDPGAIQAFLRQTGLAARVFLDNGLQRQFQVSGLPTTLLIGADGTVRARHLGPVNQAQLEQLLRELERQD
ncbi:TlpA family protein disulfide reductase [Meiothermus rufus]|uniref:TlpA family protein disulfide reductase n=1 Tax=Meiothermus rufus TaxID=604332 RepID=UPI0004045A59|nr:redoxin family protein [Meiothermus rufus]